jgi:bifunctional DNA-binding transcriptional regulator/antitoxin component of YhaV-PrlF toxin-antitoxin module
MVHVVSNARGRLTLPAEIREALHLEGETHWTVEVREGAVILRPAVLVPRQDAWAFTPEARAALQRADADSAAGRTIRLSGADMTRLAELPDDALAEAAHALRDAAQLGGAQGQEAAATVLASALAQATGQRDAEPDAG